MLDTLDYIMLAFMFVFFLAIVAGLFFHLASALAIAPFLGLAAITTAFIQSAIEDY